MVETSSANLWPILAGIRFFLAVVVVSSHWTYVETNTDPFFRWVSPLGGFAAVLGFLLISGYSIAHSYTVESRTFFARRVARIFPVYIVCTAGLWALFAINGEPGVRTTAGSVLSAPSFADTLQNLLMLQGATTGPTVSPAWSLSIECWFYLFTPLLACCRLNVVRALALASVVIYFFIVELSLTNPAGLLFGLPAIVVGWAWLLGFILYRGRMRPADLALTIVIGPVLLNRWENGDLPLSSLTYLAVCVALLLGSRIRLGPRANRLLNYLGELSYPLYLVHLSGAMIANGYFGVENSALLLGIDLLVSALLVHAIDHPLRPLLRRLRIPMHPVNVARLLLTALALACIVALANYLRTPVLAWGAILGACAVVAGLIARPSRTRMACNALACAIFCAMLANGAFPSWATRTWGGTVPSALAFPRPENRRVVEGVQDDWVVGNQAKIYLGTPRAGRALSFAITASVPDLLAGQIVRVTSGACELGSFRPGLVAAEVSFPIAPQCLDGDRATIGLTMSKVARGPDIVDTRLFSLQMASASLRTD